MPILIPQIKVFFALAREDSILDKMSSQDNVYSVKHLGFCDNEVKVDNDASVISRADCMYSEKSTIWH